MRAFLLIVALGGVALGDAPVPDHYGRQVRFAGIHPIPKSEGGGMCYIEGPHVHIYAANKLEYRDEGPDHVFVGDPAAYGYDGPKVAYKGPHPIVVEVNGAPHTEYCYLDGPHFHPSAPPDGPDFKLVGNAYFYVGAPPQAFVDARPRFAGINAVYEPLAYARPVVEVEAPVGWVGARAELAPPHGRVDVAAPDVRAGVGIDVHLPPPPTISVGVGVNVGVGGAVVVGGHRGRH
jgi:hypothetical protein